MTYLILLAVLVILGTVVCVAERTGQKEHDTALLLWADLLGCVWLALFVFTALVLMAECRGI